MEESKKEKKIEMMDGKRKDNGKDRTKKKGRKKGREDKIKEVERKKELTKGSVLLVCR